MLDKSNETMNYIIGERSKLAQRVYKKQHIWVERKIHGESCNREFKLFEK